MSSGSNQVNKQRKNYGAQNSICPLDLGKHGPCLRRPGAPKLLSWTFLISTLITLRCLRLTGVGSALEQNTLSCLSLSGHAGILFPPISHCRGVNQLNSWSVRVTAGPWLDPNPRKMTWQVNFSLSQAQDFHRFVRNWSTGMVLPWWFGVMQIVHIDGTVPYPQGSIFYGVSSIRMCGWQEIPVSYREFYTDESLETPL